MFLSDAAKTKKMKRQNKQKKSSELTMSTSEIVSKLSTWTSTPTGIGGPEIQMENKL